MSSYGFDNVSVGGLSPTLLERYLAAAQKISRLAVGSPVRVAGEHVVVLPADLTQEEHVDGLPFGTRGGSARPPHVSARRRVRDSEFGCRGTATRTSRG